MDPTLSGKKVSMHLGRVRRSLAVACVLPLLLAACSEDEPEPKMPKPTASTSPAAEETPVGPVEPTLPPEAEGDGVKAAEAFVPFFYETVDYAQTTGATKPLRDLSVPTCRSCKGGAEVIDRIHKSGGTITGGEHTVERAEVTGTRRIPGEGSIFYLAVDVSHTEQTVEGSKDLDGTYGAGTNELRYQVVRTEDDWQVLEWSER